MALKPVPTDYGMITISLSYPCEEVDGPSILTP